MTIFSEFRCLLGARLSKAKWITTTGLVGRVFANGPGDLGSIQGRVIPKTLKMVLDTSLLNTQQYKVHIKGKVLGVVAIEKGAFWPPSTMIANFTDYKIFWLLWVILGLSWLPLFLDTKTLIFYFLFIQIPMSTIRLEK